MFDVESSWCLLSQRVDLAVANPGREHANEHPNPGNTSIEGKEEHDRGIIRYATLDEFKKAPGFAHEGEGKEPVITGIQIQEVVLPANHSL